MMIFRKSIARRSFLRGAGAAVALPFLEAMTPAFTHAQSAAAKPPVRLSVVFVPNGRIKHAWLPEQEGAGYELPTTLQPLAPHRDHFQMLSGLSSLPKEALLRSVGLDAGPHATASGVFLTGVYPKPSGLCSITMDQIVARETARHTQLASMELSLHAGEMGAGADGADSDAYLNTFSWRSESTPLPVESNPRKVFERLFGDLDSTDPAERRRRIHEDSSILDIVLDEVEGLKKQLGSTDRMKVAEYLEAVRDVERRIQIAEKDSHRELPVLVRPAGIPTVYDEHARIMFDLQVLAFQTDMTRVITFALEREKSERAYREIGLEEGHHALTHHGYNPEMMAKCVKLETYQSEQFAYFLEKMRSIREPNGTLLDNSVVLFASSISDGHSHSRADLPVVLAGGAGGRLKGGRHVRYSDETPLTNLFLAIVDLCGVPVDEFGDSTGKLDLLSVA